MKNFCSWSIFCITISVSFLIIAVIEFIKGFYFAFGGFILASIGYFKIRNG